VAGEEVGDVAGHLHPAMVQHDHPVTRVLDVGHHVRGQHDGHPAVGHRGHQPTHDLVPCQRVQVGERLVQHQQLRPLGEGEGQRDLRLLAAGEPADLAVQRDPELREPGTGQLVVPPGVHAGAEAQHVGHREPVVQRLVLRQERDAGQRLTQAGGAAQHRNVPLVRRQQTDEHVQQRRLTRPVRPDERDHPARRHRQRAVLESPVAPVPLTKP